MNLYVMIVIVVLAVMQTGVDILIGVDLSRYSFIQHLAHKTTLIAMGAIIALILGG